MAPKVTDALVLVPPQQAGRPAALAPVANRPLLSHLLDSLVRAEIEQVVVASDEGMAPALRAATEGRNGDGPAVEVRGFRELSLAGALAAGSGSGRLLVHFADCL